MFGVLQIMQSGIGSPKGVSAATTSVTWMNSGFPVDPYQPRDELPLKTVIASGAKQSSAQCKPPLDCFVAIAPRNDHRAVMAGLVPAIHAFSGLTSKTWIPGIKPGMTEDAARNSISPYLKLFCRRIF
jgi:hypothetical protein